MKKPYESPKVTKLGMVAELTHAPPGIDKCSGENDTGFPQQLSNNFAFDCD